MSNLINCPACNTEFSVETALGKRLEAEYERKLKENDRLMAVERRKLSEAQRQLEADRADFDASLEMKLESERSKVEKTITDEVTGRWKAKTEALEGLLSKSEEKLKAAQAAELALLKKQHEVEERERELELTLTKRLKEGRAAVVEEVTKQVADDYRRRDLEREIQMADLRKQIVEWKQKAEQGSQQLQGEALEVELETLLKSEFPTDVLTPVPKGFNGADLIQEVIGNAGQRYGKIAWETKRTKTFNSGWIRKLKEDRNAAGAAMGIIVSEAMPHGSGPMCEIEGIWIVRPELAGAVARILRETIRDVARAKATSAAMAEKAEVIFNYLVSQTFRQRMETIVESFVCMREDLEREKRATQKGWKVREHQLERIFQASLGMYTDIQSVIGSTSFQIQALEGNAPPETV